MINVLDYNHFMALICTMIIWGQTTGIKFENFAENFGGRGKKAAQKITILIIFITIYISL